MRAVLSRLIQLVIVLFLVSLLTFTLLTALPGSAADVRIGSLPNSTPQERVHAIAQLEHELGLDRPWIVQFWIWLRNAMQGNFGTDLQGSKVSSVIAERTEPTLELAAASVIIAVLVSTTLAIFVHRTRFRSLKASAHVMMTALLVVPEFWIGLLLVIAFGAGLEIFPASGYVPLTEDAGDNLKHLVLPAVTIAAPQMALYFRYLSAGLDEASTAPFVISARARGLSARRVVYSHILPNGVLPTITVVGLVIGSLLSGLVVVESVFSWPGLGSLLVQSANVKDYNLLSAIVLLTAAVYVVAAVVVDLVYLVVDPRIRRSR